MSNSLTPVRINIRSVTNADVRTEKRNGRDVMIIPSATLPDNIVMNGIMYPAEEISKGFMTLNRTPAPLGHPTINGRFVSASDPEGINVGYIGAWNENVRRVNGRVFLDKIIDVEVANRSEGGKAVLAAINAKKPIHTSTGLLCKLEEVQNAEGYSSIARELYFDHDAILLNEEGAATPEQGVGMLVNGEQIKVINSALDMAQTSLDWAGMDLIRAMEGIERATLWEKMKAAILGVIGSAESSETTTRKEADMAQTDAAHEALNKKVDDLSASLKGLIDGIPSMISNAIKPMVDHIELQANAEKAKSEAKKTELVNKVVKANLLTEEIAKTLSNEALEELAKKISTTTNAAALSGAFFGANSSDANEFASYDPNAAIEGKK